ncbi:MAG: class B sortase, partial [Turicibacter sp.]|nr:class B sortase [Turicibacter sp.]
MKNKPIIRFFRGTDKLINFCMMFLLLGLLLYGGYSLWDTNQMFNQASAFAYEIYHPMREEEPGFDGLRAINPDVFGWLTVFGTNIDYPLVQGTDNLHYVDTNARGLPALTGAIFLDFRNNQNFTDFNNIIYGHDMAREAMFGEIANFADEGYFNARQFGSIFTGQRHYGVEFFAFLLVDAHDSGFYNPRMSDQIVKADHLDRIREEAIQFRDVDVTTADQLVMLSTCTETITNGRFVLIGRLTNHIEQNPFADARVGTGRFVRAWAGLFHSPVAIFVGAITGTLLIILLTLMTLSTVKRLKEKGARGTGPTEQAEEETSLLPIDQKKGAHLVRREFIYLSSKILGIVLVITLVVTFVFGFVSVEDFAMSP